MAANAPAVANSAMKKMQEAEAGVLGHVAGDELGLGDRHVERRLGELGLHGDHEDDEADELGEDVRVAEAVPAEDRAGRSGRATMPCRFIVPAWITTPTTASTIGSS